MDDDPMKISVLSSGSGGNVTYIETDQHKVLLDAGLSGKKIEKLMNSINRSLTDVDKLFVSHEHTDHAKSVGILARKYDMEVYANEKTWNAMGGKIGKFPEEQKYLFDPDTTQSFSDLDVESFSVSHDAADAQFYNFHHNGKSFVVLTDTGYVSEHVEGIIRNANGYVLECNHDPEMLRNGDYSWPTKQRILSDTGHLSNEDGADTMMDVIGENTEEVFIGHRSHHNNTRPLARLTVASILKQNDMGVGHDFNLYDTDVEKPSDLLTL